MAFEVDSYLRSRGSEICALLADMIAIAIGLLLTTGVLSIYSANRQTFRTSSDLQRMQASSRPELLGLLQAGIEMDLLFRTDEHVLPPSTQAASPVSRSDAHIG